MNGRRLNVVLAACLYISVRSEGANVILLDISDVSEANVYDIGRYYFQIVRILNFNITTVDPSEYTIRFVDMLELGKYFMPIECTFNHYSNLRVFRGSQIGSGKTNCH